MKRHAATNDFADETPAASIADALSDAAWRLFQLGRGDSAKAILHSVDPETLNKDGLRLLNKLRRIPGVSIIMPSYRGVERIGRALESIASQTLHPGMFELIVVLNGPGDGTDAVLADFRLRHPSLNVEVMRSEQTGASNARNLGLRNLRFDHAVFLDDDDYLSPGFLEAMHRGAGEGDRVVLSQLRDFDADGVRDSEIGQRIRRAFGEKSEAEIGELHGLDTALTMTCIKLFPSFYADFSRFQPHLGSGEDVVFWTDALSRFQPRITRAAEDAIYYRQLRDGSVSRRALSFQFNVLDRLAVITCLDAIHQRHPGQFVLSKILAGVGFMLAYLRERPAEYQRVIEAIRASNVSVMREMLRYLNEKLRDKLVVSYCFPPALDTAAVVAAKRLAVAGEAFDVISNDMSAVRKSDDRLLDICHQHVGREIICKSAARWRIDAGSGLHFAEHARTHAIALSQKRPYRALYSRAMWPASHLAAANIKAALPEISWQAEFSDPIAVDIMGEDRPGEIDPEWLERTGIARMIRDAGFPPFESTSVMKCCEYVAYALADELLFTNVNQMGYMLSQPWIAPLRDRIESRAVIRPHPTLPPSFYTIAEDTWSPSGNRISIGYFGSFYRTRGLDELLIALGQLDSARRKTLQLDIYTGSQNELRQQIAREHLTGTVAVHDTLPYLDFLARSRKYDFLLVNDTFTEGLKPCNPYLPSKVSDYLGAGTRIWRLAEPGSPLSLLDLPAGSLTSRLGDVASYRAALERMATGRIAMAG